MGGGGSGSSRGALWLFSARSVFKDYVIRRRCVCVAERGLNLALKRGEIERREADEGNEVRMRPRSLDPFVAASLPSLSLTHSHPPSVIV